MPADVLTQIFPALRGAFACVAIVAGLAVMGRGLRNGTEFQAADILRGWGLSAAFMTTISILFFRPLELGAFFIFGTMLGREARLAALDEPKLEAVLNEVVDALAFLIERPEVWRAVVAVADRLPRTGRIAGAEIARIVAKAMAT